MKVWLSIFVKFTGNAYMRSVPVKQSNKLVKSNMFVDGALRISEKELLRRNAEVAGH